METTKKLNSGRKFLKAVDWRINCRPDVCFLCKDGELWSHRILLCHVSTLMRATIVGDDQWKGTDIFITIPDLLCSQLNQLLDLAYKGEARCPSAAEMCELKRNILFLGWLPGAEFDELLERPLAKSSLPKVHIKTEKQSPPSEKTGHPLIGSGPVSDMGRCNSERAPPDGVSSEKEIQKDCNLISTSPSHLPLLNPVKRTHLYDDMDSLGSRKKNRTDVPIRGFSDAGHRTPSVTRDLTSTLKKPTKRTPISLEEKQQDLLNWIEHSSFHCNSKDQDESDDVNIGNAKVGKDIKQKSIHGDTSALLAISEKSPSVVRDLFNSSSRFKSPTLASSSKAEVSEAKRKAPSISWSQPTTSSTSKFKTNLSRRSRDLRSPQSQPFRSPTSATAMKDLICPDKACMHPSNNANFLIRHVESQHPNFSKNLCYNCMRVFKSRRELDRHKANLFNRCRTCERIFCSLRDFRKHSQIMCQELTSRSPGMSKCSAYTQSQI